MSMPGSTSTARPDPPAVGTRLCISDKPRPLTHGERATAPGASPPKPYALRQGFPQAVGHELVHAAGISDSESMTTKDAPTRWPGDPELSTDPDGKSRPRSPVMGPPGAASSGAVAQVTAPCFAYPLLAQISCPGTTDIRSTPANPTRAFLLTLLSFSGRRVRKPEPRLSLLGLAICPPWPCVRRRTAMSRRVGHPTSPPDSPDSASRVAREPTARLVQHTRGSNRSRPPRWDYRGATNRPGKCPTPGCPAG